MAILDFLTDAPTGLVDVEPQIIYIKTNDIQATVLTPGYVDSSRQSGAEYEETMMACVYTTDEKVGWYTLTIDPVTLSVTLFLFGGDAGNVQLPVAINHIATFVDVNGVIGDLSTNAIHGGSIQAGLDGTFGGFIAYPSIANRGTLQLSATSNTGTFNVIITNSAVTRNTTYQLPDAGTSATLFITRDSADSSTFQALNTNLAINGTGGTATLSLGLPTVPGSIQMFCGGPSLGAVIISAQPQLSNVNLIIRNAAMNQSTFLTIPDPVSTTANFLISKSAGTQTITSGNFQVSQGTITTGSNGSAGGFTIFPPTVGTGKLDFVISDNSPGVNITLQTESFAQNCILNIPDTGVAATRFIMRDISGGGGGLQEIKSALLINNELQLGSSSGSGSPGIILLRIYNKNQVATVGSLVVQSAPNAGDYQITIQNHSFGQITDLGIPDPGFSSGDFVLKSGGSAFATGNLPIISNSSGIIGDSTIVATNVQKKTDVVAAVTGNIGGAGAGPISVSVTGLTASSVVVPVVKSSSNPCQVQTTVAGSGSFNVTVSADPGASLIIEYIAYKSPQ